jgi:hypothetical protein
MTRKFYIQSKMFADGGQYKHIQEYDVLMGEDDRPPVKMGITQVTRKGWQTGADWESIYTYKGKEYKTWDKALAVFLEDPVEMP